MPGASKDSRRRARSRGKPIIIGMKSAPVHIMVSESAIVGSKGTGTRFRVYTHSLEEVVKRIHKALGRPSTRQKIPGGVRR